MSYFIVILIFILMIGSIIYKHTGMSYNKLILLFIFIICSLIYFVLDYCRYHRWLSIYKKLYSEFGDDPTNHEIEKAKRIVESYGNLYTFTTLKWGKVPGQGPVILLRLLAILVFVVAIAPLLWHKFID